MGSNISICLSDIMHSLGLVFFIIVIAKSKSLDSSIQQYPVDRSNTAKPIDPLFDLKIDDI